MKRTYDIICGIIFLIICFCLQTTAFGINSKAPIYCHQGECLYCDEANCMIISTGIDNAIDNTDIDNIDELSSA